MMKKSFQQQRKEGLILRALQNIFLLKIQKADPKWQNSTISITRVETSQTGSFVRVFINVFPEEKQQMFVETMNEQKSQVRGFLGDALKDKLRTIPDIKFFVDDALKRMRRIEELLKDQDIM